MSTCIAGFVPGDCGPPCEAFTCVPLKKMSHSCVPLKSWSSPTCPRSNFSFPSRHSVSILLDFSRLTALTCGTRLEKYPPCPLGHGGNDDEAESDAHNTRGFASRRCGLLPTRCVKSALLLSCGSRRGTGRPFLSTCGGSKRVMDPLLQNAQQLQHTGDDFQLDRMVRELYRRRGGRPRCTRKRAIWGCSWFSTGQTRIAATARRRGGSRSRGPATPRCCCRLQQARRRAPRRSSGVARPPVDTASRCFWRTRRPLLPGVRSCSRRRSRRCSSRRCPSSRRSRGSRARCRPCRLGPRLRPSWGSMCSPGNTLRCRGAPLIRPGWTVLAANGTYVCTVR